MMTTSALVDIKIPQQVIGKIFSLSASGHDYRIWFQVSGFRCQWIKQKI